MENISMHDMSLHDTSWSEKCQKRIIRVPGLWIYEDYDCENDCPIPCSGGFVPFSDKEI